MLFNSIEFIFMFVPAALASFFLLPKFLGGRSAVFILLFFSMVFYAYWSFLYLVLLISSIVLNYSIGKSISNSPAHSKKFLFSGVFLNLSILGYFKYTGFVIGEFLPNNYVDSEWIFDIVLPLAISFYTFQQISYLVDSYRNKSCASSLEEYALFVMFFPQLIAGPIVRQDDVVSQYNSPKLSTWDGARFSIGLALFSCGLFKKVVVADQLALSVAPVFSSAAAGNPVQFFEGWIGALSYTFQIYFDFSGYADMAVGLGLMFGIRLPINFLSPYKSRSIIDFWSSWHITLSRFLREYVYIPLGGNRLGAIRKYANISLVMLLGGIWHGAGWQFIVWGGLHGAMIVVNHFARDAGSAKLLTSINRRLSQITCYLFTFFGVVIAWVFFRAESLEVL